MYESAAIISSSVNLSLYAGILLGYFLPIIFSMPYLVIKEIQNGARYALFHHEEGQANNHQGPSAARLF